MGQYFVAVNQDKREYVCPWCLGRFAKLRDWAMNDQVRSLVLLLRQSSDGGEGDYYGDNQVVGSWAGDCLALVGNYDQSGLFDHAMLSYRNISPLIAEAVNEFTAANLKIGTCEGCGRR